MGFIFIYSGFDLLEGSPSVEKSEQDSWGAVEALTVSPTENKGLHRVGSGHKWNRLLKGFNPKENQLVYNHRKFKRGFQFHANPEYNPIKTILQKYFTQQI